jgi:hypothetical protein
MRDLLDALPKPPLDDIGDHHVLQEVVFRHAEKLLENRVLSSICLGDLRDALARTWLLYIQWQAISVVWKTQHRDILSRTGGLKLFGPAVSCAGAATRGRPLPRLRLYRDIFEKRRSDRKRAKAALKYLARLPRNRPTEFRDHFFIQAMRIIWDRHSASEHRGWTASGWTGTNDSRQGPDGVSRAGQDGPFQRFVHDWLLAIDPGRRAPSRQIFAVIKQRMQKQPS